MVWPRRLVRLTTRPATSYPIVCVPVGSACAVTQPTALWVLTYCLPVGSTSVSANTPLYPMRVTPLAGSVVLSGRLSRSYVTEVVCPTASRVLLVRPYESYAKRTVCAGCVVL